MGELSKNQIKKLQIEATTNGAEGLIAMKVMPDGTLNGPPSKHLTQQEIDHLKETLDAKPGDLILIIADLDWEKVKKYLIK